MKVAGESSKIVASLLAIFVIFFAIVPAGGCARADGATSINLCLADFAQAYEEKDINLLKSCIAEDSSFYSELVINAQNAFARHPKIDMEFSELNINLYEDGRRATVTLEEIFKGIGEDGRITEETKSGDIFEMIKSETDWKITSWYRDIYMIELPNEYQGKK